MNKAELVSAVAGAAELTKKDTEKALKALTAAITAELSKKGGKVALPELGSFKVVERKARKVRNPRTGETMTSPACKVAKFTPAKALKENINTKKKKK